MSITRVSQQSAVGSQQSPVGSQQAAIASREMPVVVVGGGFAGLVSATLVAKAGLPAVLLEKTSAVGGRASTREKDGFLFNLGPHALDRHGVLRQTLQQLGVDVRGGIPAADGGFAIAGGRAHTLPVGFTSLLTTGVLTVAAKFEFARLLSRLPSVDAAPLQRQTLQAWLDANVHDTVVRQLFEMLVRVTTFTNDPGHQSAGAAIEQMQLSLAGSVLYLDGGWQTIVDGLRRAAAGAGVRVIAEAAAVSLERRDARAIDAVRLADGTIVPASAVIVTGGPADVEQLIGGPAVDSPRPPAVRLATLDIALRALPKPKRTVAFGLDAPLYFSVHSAFARLAPAGGAVIHMAKYLRPDEVAGRDVERELEATMDMMQPGWRSAVQFRQFLPNLVVTHAQVAAARGGMTGRPGTRLPAFDNVFIAGDWVGPRGQLSDAAAASAADAAHAAIEVLRTLDSPSSPALAQDRAHRPAIERRTAAAGAV
jgi:phytoene dehydrogenase-like protein